MWTRMWNAQGGEIEVGPQMCDCKTRPPNLDHCADRPKWCGTARSHDLDDRTLVGCDEVRHTDSGHVKDRMKFDLYTKGALKCDAPEHRLRRGDIVKLWTITWPPNGTEGYSIEVFNALGDLD